MASPLKQEDAGKFEQSYQAHPKEHAAEEDKLEPIAVTGLALRFPQDATSPQAFWEMLLQGRSAMTEVPKDRWNIDAFYHPNPERHDSMNARGGHFLKEDIAVFDAPFFSLPPAEAVSMDPQQRGLLECTYHALENAGVPMAKVVGSQTSVHVGSFSREYETLVSRDPQLQAKYLATGTGTAMLANRLSWFYDLHGPSISLDTACSSSLNALHLAAQSLRCGESSMALVAGCNLMLNPDTNSIPLSNLSFLSPDSRCYSFDHRANGYARGEGTAVVVLKRLSDAVKDNDVIRAVIRATGSNQDGRTPGITQPSKDAQEAMIRETYAAGGLDFQRTGFFEAHGTGTPVGDPREAAAIAAVFKDRRSTPLIVGAVKSNIGHLEGASGLAGLIKTILILEKGIIPRNIWFEKVNSDIPADEWKIEFPTEAKIWPTDGLRRASVNSFGYGGANAHVVLDDAFHYLKVRGLVGKHCSVESPRHLGIVPPVEQDDAPAEVRANGVLDAPCSDSIDPQSSRIFVWSASDEGGLNRLATSYQKYLQRVRDDVYSEKFLGNLAYTLSNRRSNLPWKSSLVARTVADLQKGLSGGNLPRPVRSSSSLQPTLSFIFTGQGAQWYAMGRELLTYPTFRNSLQRAEEYLQLLGCKWRLIDELIRAEDVSNVNNPAYAQPMCTALQVALVELFSSWNIFPTAVAGHSSGEIAAAFCAGGLSRESAWKISYFRGLLAARLVEAKQRNGSMIAVALSQQQIQPYLIDIAAQMGEGRLSIGCINSPNNVTVTGDKECVDVLKVLMDQQRIFARKLPVTVAYHSSHMQDIASEYRSLIQGITGGSRFTVEGKMPALFSTVTGTYVATARLTQPDYWVTNMVSQVRFSDAVNELCSSLVAGLPNPNDTTQIHLIEVGPHGALRRPIKEILNASPNFKGIAYHAALMQDVSAVQLTLELAGSLHCAGYIIDLPSINSPAVNKSELQLLSDLPEYPFNHSQSYWLESRLSRNFRFRKVPRHELLGVPVTDWNPLEGQWRNFIRALENPWIKDHKFNGSELYPAAGMIVMAIEAARQIADSNARISAYRLEDISFFRPLLVSLAPEGVETKFHLRPQRSGSTTSSDCNAFHLYLYSTDEWIEICRGTIITEYRDSQAELDSTGEDNFRDLRESFKNGVNSCKRALHSRDLYQNLATYGMEFGTTFQALQQVYFSSDSKATAIMNPRDWMAKVPGSDEIQDHVIHPTALDSIIHLTAVALSNGTWEPIRTMVPTKIQRLWISNDLLAHTENQRLQVYTHPTFRGFRDVEFTIAAFDTLKSECQIAVEGYRGTAISSLESSAAEMFGWKRHCFDLEWKPDLDLLTDKQISSYCNATVTASDLLPPELVDATELICLYFISAALETISKDDFTTAKPHIAKYIEWMQHQRALHEAGTLVQNTINGKTLPKDKAHVEKILADLWSGPEKELYVMVGEKLVQILRGEVDALSFIFNGDLVRSFFAGGFFSPSYSKAAEYIDLLAHKDPTLKLLEIGAGTGGTTAPILEKLAKHGRHERGVSRYDQYVFTDISTGFFEGARKRFREHADRMEYQSLDIEKDPALQGFEPETFDVVVASGVLHATSNVESTLRNARKLLKPGGKLVLLEPCNLDVVRIAFVFGLLPGWWLSTEKYRSWGPLLAEEGWHQALLRSGFSGAEVCLRDYQDHRHTMSVIISTNPETEVVSLPRPQTLIVIADDSAQQLQLASQVESRLQSLGVSRRETIGFRDLRSRELKDTFCIVLPEMDKPLLYNIGEEEFASLKSMVKSASGILWLTRGRERRPELGLITGLGRTLRSENPEINFVELAIEHTTPIPEVAQQVIKVFEKSLTSQGEQAESEYLEKDSILYVNRVVEANYLNDRLHSRLSAQKPEVQKLRVEPQRALKLTICTPGLLDTLQFEDNEVAEQPLAADEVEIEVKAIGVNFKDVIVALGQVPANTLGLECSGIIARTGHGISDSRLKPGARVCCIAMGAYATRVRSYAPAVSTIPDAMSFSTAAAFPLVFCTAYYALIDVGRLREKESVLIHSGAGGVGQAAIQIAKMLKAEIFVTVGNKEKRKLLMDLYRIPDDHIFVGRGASFVLGLKKMISGVDVVLNSFSGEGLRRSLDCLASFGRFVDISKTDIQGSEQLPMTPFSRNITYSSVDLALVFGKSKTLMGELMTSVMNLVASGAVQAPQPLHVYRSSEIQEAFRFLQGGKNAGKTIVELHEEDLVPVVPSTRPTDYFDENASYVITGGLGGLGRSIARWMVDRRAKHLILLGRSGARPGPAQEFLDEMKSRGVAIAAPPCDISDERALQSTLDACSQTMPPIKGCIQGSMVLRDGVFESMSLEDYNAVIKPKAHGSWNLHQHLPADMDFFILLSSAGGILGTRGQSNYASGNTYQDALAHYRVARGQKCMSLDLGLVLSVGFAAEKTDIIDSLKQLGYTGIREAEFLAMLDYLCDPALPLPPSPLQSQIVTGLQLPKALKSTGMDSRDGGLYWARWAHRPLFRNLVHMNGSLASAGRKGASSSDLASSSNDASDAPDYDALFQAADSPATAGRHVVQGLRRKLSKMLCVAEADVDAAKPMYAFGVDSLVAVEVRYWLAKTFRADLSIFEIMGNESLAEVGEGIARRRLLVGVRNGEVGEGS